MCFARYRGGLEGILVAIEGVPKVIWSLSRGPKGALLAIEGS